jgi:hypothetical protein
VKSAGFIRFVRIGGLFFAMTCIGAYLLSKGTGQTFIADEWMFVAARQEISPSTLFADHNGHLVAIPALVYMIAFELVGLNGYRLLAYLAIVAHLGTALLITRYLSTRVGRAFSLGAGLVVALSGAGAQNYVWGFQITFMGSVICFLLAVVSYDRRNVSWHWRVVTVVFLIFSLSFSGVGVSALIAMSISVVALGRLRRDWWVFSIPAIFYALWYLRFAEQTPNARASVGQIVRFILDGSAGSISETFGLDVGWGRLALGFLVAWMVFDASRRGMFFRRYVWFVFFLLFWTITAFSRAGFGDPFSSRYLWVGQICLVLTIGELLPFHGSRLDNRRAWGVAVVLTVLSFFGSRTLFIENARFQKNVEDVAVVRSTIALTNRNVIADDVAVHSIWGYTLIKAEEFFEAVDRFGQPRTFGLAEVLNSDERRVAADMATAEFGLSSIEATNVRCENSMMVNSIRVIPGGSVSFRVESNMIIGVTIRRFASATDAGVLPQRQLGAGVHTARLIDDGGQLPLELTLTSPVMLCG